MAACSVGITVRTMTGCSCQLTIDQDHGVGSIPTDDGLAQLSQLGVGRNGLPAA